MSYRCHIEVRHDLREKWIYVYQGDYLLVPDELGYELVPIDPAMDNRELGPTLRISDSWADAVLRAWLEFEHGHTGSESLLSDRLSIETKRFDKLLDKLMEQL